MIGIDRVSHVLASIVLASLPAAPVLAANPDCKVFGEIAEKAVVARQAETDMMDAMVKIAAGYTGDQERFAGTVPFIVDYVWNLDEGVLGDEVGAAWVEQCEAQ